MSIIDIALILIFVVTVIVAAKKGFIKSVSGIIAWILAASLAMGLCTTVSTAIYNTMLKDRVIESIDEHINVSDEAAEVATVASLALQSLPDFAVSAAESMGIDIEEIEKKAEGFTVDEKGLAAALEESVAGPIVSATTKMVVFVLMLILFSILLTFLLKPVGKLIEKLPLIKQANTLLGVALGFVKAVVLVIVLSMLMELFAGFAENEFSKAVEQSGIVDFVVESRITDTFFIK